MFLFYSVCVMEHFNFKVFYRVPFHYNQWELMIIRFDWIQFINTNAWKTMIKSSRQKQRNHVINFMKCIKSIIWCNTRRIWPFVHKESKIMDKGLSNDNHDHTDNLWSSRVNVSLQYNIQMNVSKWKKQIKMCGNSIHSFVLHFFWFCSVITRRHY